MLQVRVIEETKTELHTRADDLANTLWELSDAERDTAEAERTAVRVSICTFVLVNICTFVLVKPANLCRDTAEAERTAVTQLAGFTSTKVQILTRSGSYFFFIWR
jgi:hypothetical protein